MEPARAGNLLTYLSQVPDPRGRKGRRHSLPAMLTAIICALLCGHRGYTGIAEWLPSAAMDQGSRLTSGTGWGSPAGLPDCTASAGC